MTAPEPASVTAAILSAVNDPAQPLLTFYDDDTGERTELSTATLGNWAAKTANFLRDEAGVLPGEEVVVDLPEHWQTAAVLLGAWWAGAHVQVPGDGYATSADARVVITTRDRLDAHPDSDEVLVASLDAFALPITDLPPGVGDYASAVRVHGDRFAGVRHRGPALNGVVTAQVIAEARAAADTAGLGTGQRLLSTREWRTPQGITANLVAPLVVGTGLVWVAHPGSALDHRAQMEKADSVLR